MEEEDPKWILWFLSSQILTYTSSETQFRHQVYHRTLFESGLSPAANVTPVRWRGANLSNNSKDIPPDLSSVATSEKKMISGFLISTEVTSCDLAHIISQNFHLCSKSIQKSQPSNEAIFWNRTFEPNNMSPRDLRRRDPNSIPGWANREFTWFWRKPYSRISGCPRHNGAWKLNYFSNLNTSNWWPDPVCIKYNREKFSI